MTNNEDDNLRIIRRALLSVSDKTGIVEFARALVNFKVEIISTGGTANALRDAGIAVVDVSDVTGFPEMMDGRIKTLHPKVHGGLLALRDNLDHVAAMNQHGIEPIDLVVVNLYPFERTIRRAGVSESEAVEQIDIGGPAMIRSAAKNWRDVAVVVRPESYARIIEELITNKGALSLATRSECAREAFLQTARYDMLVHAFLTATHSGLGGITAVAGGLSGKLVSEEPTDLSEFFTRPFEGNFPTHASWTSTKKADLRYGENPHQRAALYQLSARGGIADAELIGGKEMSYNNYVDADAAWQLVSDFEEIACAIIKHTNPAGVGLGTTVAEAYEKAHSTDPVSAFGGIVAFNSPVDETAAALVIKIFTEVVIAPAFEAAALDLLRTKKNLRILRLRSTEGAKGLEFKHISGGMLLQTIDNHKLQRSELKVVTDRQPSEEEIRALLFAWTVCKHTKSNAIVYARSDRTVGVGAGQMSRVDSVKLGAMRAQISVEGSVLASDAFFPFRDGIDEAAKHGITAIIQPGGSVRDEEVIAAANEHNVAMVFTGVRHFKH